MAFTTDPTPAAVAAATAASIIVYDTKDGTFTPSYVETYTDNDHLFIYLKGGKYQMIDIPMVGILSISDSPVPYDTSPILARWAEAISKNDDIMQVEMSLDTYGSFAQIKVAFQGNHPTLGFLFHAEFDTPTIHDCDPNTSAANIEQWCSRFRNGASRAINDEMVDTVDKFKPKLTELRTAEATTCAVTIAHKGFGNLYTTHGLP